MDLLYSPKAPSINNGGYIDMLEELGKHSFASLRFATKDYKPTPYVHCQKRQPNQVWKAALKSDRVQWIINQIVREENKDYEAVANESEAILKELAYTDHLSLVRTLGFMVYHIISVIYKDGVFINVDQVDKIRSVIKHHPVVFMPTHRSYMDFIMLSIVCFFLDLSLPAIAAGMDFMGMKIMGSVLRSCGAFFMRRSFGSDRLYWALFTEYVHTILINGDRPMEFFIEGTRSRVGKSLNPKFGLLSVIAEPYLKAQTYDIIIIPVSISYDRLLEERLYAYELLGVPKPKESTSGIFKASSILQDNYGSVHMHFGKLISLRDYFNDRDRAIHACYPRYMLRLTSEEEKLLKVLGYNILLKQQENMTYTPWSCISLMLSMHSSEVDLQVIVDELTWFNTIIIKCNIKVKWPPGTMDEIVRQNLQRFKHLVSTKSTKHGHTILSVSEGEHTRPVVQCRPHELDNSIRNSASVHLMLANYRNQMLHLFIRPALVVYTLGNSYQLTGEQRLRTSCMKDFEFLRKLLSKEFIFEPLKENEDFDTGLKFLEKCNVVSTQNGYINVLSNADKLIMFLKSSFQEFMVSYWLTCQYLLAIHISHSVKDLFLQIQKWASTLLLADGIKPELLSLNLISNSVYALEHIGAIAIEKVNEKKTVIPIPERILQISISISKFIKVPEIDINKTQYVAIKLLANSQSKL